MPPAIHAVYGIPPRELADVAAGAVQYSPLIPDSARIEDLALVRLASAVICAPASTVERRQVIALALDALAPGAPLTVLAPNDKGGTRLATEVAMFGCTIEVVHKRHHRIVTTRRPAAPQGIVEAIAAGQPRFLPDLGLWSQPGLFSFERIDPASRLLISHLPRLAGRGADLGCGIGVLARAIQRPAGEQHLTLVDIDRRALACAARNVPAEATTFLWADVRTTHDLPSGLDFVVMNPPFHDGGAEDRALGPAFIAKAAQLLRPGGVLWLTANRHLPYEPVLGALFKTMRQVDQALGYKIYEARK